MNCIHEPIETPYGTLCHICGSILEEDNIETIPRDVDQYVRFSRKDLPQNIKNNLGEMFSGWDTKMSWLGEEMYMKLSNGLIFKGRFRKAILIVIKYLFESKRIS